MTRKKSSIGRKLKKTTRTGIKRRAEGKVQHNLRLEGERLRKKEKRSKETLIESEIRCGKNRLQMKLARKRTIIQFHCN